MIGDAGWGPSGHFLLLLFALIADGLVAPIPGVRTALALPLRVVRALARWFDARLNRARRSANVRRIRGALVVAVIAAGGWGAGAVLTWLARFFPHGWVIEAMAIVSQLAQARPMARAAAAARALEAGDLVAARSTVSPMVRFDAAPLDRHGVARAAIEGMTARFSAGVVGAVFWYLLAGLPGLMLYRTVGAVADAIGRPSARQADFGLAAARLDDALALFPALIAGMVLVVAALFAPQASPAGAVRGWLRDFGQRGSRDFRSEGAVAGALDLALGGPRYSDGEALPPAWIGNSRARAEPVDIRRALYLIVVGCVLVFLIAALGLGLSAA